KEGWQSDQKIIAKPPLTARPGWFSDENKWKTTPAASASVAARNFLDDAATPPCGRARRGITLDSNLFTAPMTSMTAATVQPWLDSDAAPRPLSSHPEFLENLGDLYVCPRIISIAEAGALFGHRLWATQPDLKLLHVEVENWCDVKRKDLRHDKSANNGKTQRLTRIASFAV